MPKNSTVISVSITKENANFLDEQQLSPSELIQEKINEQKRIYDTYHLEKEKLIRIKEVLEKEVQLMNEFLDYINKSDDWRKWRNENVLAKEN